VEYAHNPANAADAEIAGLKKSKLSGGAADLHRWAQKEQRK
jgi:hypothetical protein